MAALVLTVLVLLTLFGTWSFVQIARKIPAAWRGERFPNPIHAREVDTRTYISFALAYLPLLGGMLLLFLGLVIQQTLLLFVGGGLVLVSFPLFGLERIVRKRNRPRWLVPPPFRD